MAYLSLLLFLSQRWDDGGIGGGLAQVRGEPSDHFSARGCSLLGQLEAACVVASSMADQTFEEQVISKLNVLGFSKWCSLACPVGLTQGSTGANTDTPGYELLLGDSMLAERSGVAIVPVDRQAERSVLGMHSPRRTQHLALWELQDQPD